MHAPSEGTITYIRPLWEPLGVQTTERERFYWLLVNGKPRRYRPAFMFGISFLGSVYPDADYWRRHFPWGRSRRVDTLAAYSYFIRKCEEAGEYVPDGTPASKRLGK